MYYNVLKANELVELNSQKMQKKTLLEDGDSNLNIIALKKDEIIDTHTSGCNSAVYLLQGEIEMHFDAEKFLLEEGDILMFKKDHEHKVRALMDSKFLLIKI